MSEILRKALPALWLLILSATLPQGAEGARNAAGERSILLLGDCPSASFRPGCRTVCWDTLLQRVSQRPADRKRLLRAPDRQQRASGESKTALRNDLTQAGNLWFQRVEALLEHLKSLDSRVVARVVGEERVFDTPCYRIEVTARQGDARWYFWLDRYHDLLVRRLECIADRHARVVIYSAPNVVWSAGRWHSRLVQKSVFDQTVPGRFAVTAHEQSASDLHAVAAPPRLLAQKR